MRGLRTIGLSNDYSNLRGVSHPMAARRRLGKLAIVMAMLAWPVSSQDGVPTPPQKAVECRTGAQLVAAMADLRVGSALLPGDITLKESDWDGHDLPVLIRRDFAITSVSSRLVTLNMAFLHAKVHFTKGTTLLFRRVVLINYRSGSWHQAPGFDLLVPTPISEKAVVWLDQSAFVIKACFPLPLAMEASKEAAKQLAGNNTYILPDKLPENCSNNTNAPALDRCYAYAGRYIDVRSPSADAQHTGSPMPNGYTIHFTDTQVLCAGTLPEDCIDRLGPLGCVLYSLSLPSPPPDVLTGGVSEQPVALAVSDVSEGDVKAPANEASAPKGGNGTNQTLVVVLASVLGALFLVGVVLVAVILVRWRKRQRCANARLVTPGHSAVDLESATGGMHAARPNDESSWSPQLGGASPPGTGSEEGRQAAPSDAPCAPCWGNDGLLDAANVPLAGSKIMVINFAGADFFNKPPDDGTSESSPIRNEHSSGRGETAAPALLVITPATPQRADFRPDVRMTARSDTTTGASARPPLSKSGGLGSSICEEVKRADIGAAGRVAAADGASGGAGGGATSNVVTLLPVVLGKGAFGRVHEGMYQGARVAVKVVSESAFGVLVQPHARQAPSSASHYQQQPPVRHESNVRLDEQDDRCENTADCEAESASEPDAPDGLCSSVPQQEAFTPCDVAEELEGGRQEEQWEVMPPHSGSENMQLRHFKQEVAVLSRCQHPNVVRLLAACLTPPRMCLVMELMETSLERLIFAGGGYSNSLIPLPTLLHIAVQVGQGLEYLHPTIIHRDLKPANVLINGADTPRPVAKLTDFGLSRLRAATMPTLHPEAGTPSYLAPECYDLNNNVITHHADIYALGVLLWALLTGQEPWKDHSIVAVAYKVTVLKERLPLEHISDRRCPPKLKQLIRQCWDQDPLRRPAAAEAVIELQELQRYVGDGSVDGAHYSSIKSLVWDGQCPDLSDPCQLSSTLSEAALIQQLEGVELELGRGALALSRINTILGAVFVTVIPQFRHG